MSDDDDDICELYLTYTIDVKMIRLIGAMMIPTNLTIALSIARGEDAEDHKIELALNKARYWFDNIVSKTIAISQDNPTAFELLLDDDGSPHLNNMFLLCPDEPRDEMLATLFQAKVNALADGAIYVVGIDILTDNLNGLSFSLAGDHSIFLPKTMEDWLGDTSYFDVPWWDRDDASTFDVYVVKESDKATTPSWAYSLDFLDKSKPIKAVEGGAKVHAFKPIVIDGGKNKDDTKK